MEGRNNNGRSTPNSRSHPNRPQSTNSRKGGQNNYRQANSVQRTNQPSFQQQQNQQVNRGFNITGLRTTNANPQMGITGSNIQPKPAGGNQRIMQPATRNSIFANDSTPMQINNVNNQRQQPARGGRYNVDQQSQLTQNQQRMSIAVQNNSGLQVHQNGQQVQGQNLLAGARPSAPQPNFADARRRANELGIMGNQHQVNNNQRPNEGSHSKTSGSTGFNIRQPQQNNLSQSSGAGPMGVAISGQALANGTGPHSQGIASIHGSAISNTSKMPPQHPVSAQRRKILAAQQAATHQLQIQGPQTQSPLPPPGITLSPEQSVRQNGRFIQQHNPTSYSANEYEQRAQQYNGQILPRRSDQNHTFNYTPQNASRMSNQNGFDQRERAALIMNKSQAAREKLQSAQIEPNFNMHPQQAAQSNDLSQTHAHTGADGNTGTDKTDENNGGSVFTDNDSIEMESDLVAAEFAEDPIEKNKRYRGVAPQRVIPDRDRQRDRDYRELELNNFMISPWVEPRSEDDTAGSSSSPGRPSNNAVKEPEQINKNATSKLRPSSPKDRKQPQNPNGLNQKPQGVQQPNKAQTQMMYPLWKEEVIPDLIFGNEEEDFEMLAARNYETLDDYELQQQQLTWEQQTRQREEAEIANINFENFLIRQQLEEEEQMQQNGIEETKSGMFQQQNYGFGTEPDSVEGNQRTEVTSMMSISPDKTKQSRGGKRKTGKEYIKNVFSINTSYCRTEVELIQHVIAKCGFMETTAGGSLYWFGLSLQDKDIKHIAKKKCFYNRYPGLEFLCRKKVFCDINNRMRRTFPKLFNFSPISFLVPEEGQALQDYMQLHPKFTFIGKPSRGRGGEGIILIQKFTDIPKNIFSYEEKDMLVQRYVKTPLLLDGKKFDLRLYVLIKGYDPVEAYLADEGLVRVCTENYRMPNPQNMKNMFMHLTNFCLNKNSDNYKAPDENFQIDDNGSKRLLSSLWKSLEEQDYDVQLIKDKIADTVKKAVITMEPYLIHSYHQKVNFNHEKTKNFQILGMDILLDKKMNAWLMEVNANPSLNMFLEKDMPENSLIEPEKILSELDKFVKTKVAADAIRIVTGHGTEEFEGTYQQVLPEEDGSLDNYYIWNRALSLFEMMVSQGKQSEAVSNFQFSRLSRVPDFAKVNQFFKADLDICFKNMARKHDTQALDLHAFFDAIEQLSQKIYKDEEDIETSLDYFLDAAVAYFEEQANKQEK